MSADTLKKGSIEMLVLLILQEGEAYGYQLSQMLKERSNGKLSVQEGSLYPLLYRMESDGFIRGKDITVETKRGRTRSRVVYRLTSEGWTRLRQLKQEYDEVQEGIQNVFQNSVEIGYGEHQVDFDEEDPSVSLRSEEGDSLFSGQTGGTPEPVGV